MVLVTMSLAFAPPQCFNGKYHSIHNFTTMISVITWQWSQWRDQNL